MKQTVILASVVIFVWGCLEPYTPPVTNAIADILVVDAFVNSTNGTARVNLSRTTPLASTTGRVLEEHAEVILEDSKGTSVTIPYQQDGLYQVTGIDLSNEEKYRLLIRTSGGKEYQSDFIELKRTPPIDSISYYVEDNELVIAVSTHDPSSNSRYYRWNYDETFEYFSPFASAYIVTPDLKFETRPENEWVNRCWKTQGETKIIVGATNRLTDDVISNKIVLRIPQGSLKISVRYSVLVQQQSLSEEAYTYWLNVQKTTESLGGLFDPLPSQVIGNVKCLTNPEEDVIGFFSGGEVSEKRIFITPRDLPSNFTLYKNSGCLMDTILVEDIGPGTSGLISPIYSPGRPTLIGFTYSTINCTDCRAFGGGVLERPDFW